MKKEFSIKNDNGSAIIVVLILFIALVGYTLYFLGSAKIAADIKRKTQNDVTVTDVTARLRSVLSTPANCNATFSTGTYSGTGNLTSIRRCSGGNCYTGLFGTGTASGEELRVSGSSWDPSVTKIPQGNVRLTNIQYARHNVQTMDKPDIVTFTLTFEKRLRDNPTNPIISTIQTTLDQYVVFDGTGNVKGCPNSPSSIDIYGDLSCHRPWNYEQRIDHNTSVTAYKYQHVVGCNFSGNVQTRNCQNTVLSGDFMFETCINDGGWSAPTAGTCQCMGGGVWQQTMTMTCTNPTPDTGGLPCSGPSTYQVSCTPSPMAPCP
jgi:hypothetical protein